MEALNLEEVFFKLKIEDVFPIVGKGRTALAGRVSCGQIHDKSGVLITDAAGVVLRETRILDLNWFGRTRWEHVSAEEGMNIGILFSDADKAYLCKGHYVVIK